MVEGYKIVHAFNKVADNLFKKRGEQFFLTAQQWAELTSDQNFLEKIEQARVYMQGATWQQGVGDIASIPATLSNYAVLAVDGSQIYPDKHLVGIDCFLIHVGACFLVYGTQGSLARFWTEPFVYTPDQFIHLQTPFGAELADMVREEHEFASLVQYCQKAEQEMKEKLPLIAFFDGNLLFWHMEHKSEQVRKTFINRYMSFLDDLYKKRIPVAGVLSNAHFSDVMNLVRAGAKGNMGLKKYSWHQTLENICNEQDYSDAQLLLTILQPGQRTTVFYAQHALCRYYPPHLVPCFFYLHVGSEVVRIEIPQWVADDQALVELVCNVCLDQCQKGYGYPLALAESHAHAVIGGADRDLFFHLLFKKASEHNVSLSYSQKKLKKRIMNV